MVIAVELFNEPLHCVLDLEVPCLWLLPILTRDFSDAENLTRQQMITLAEVASFRGQADIAMKWKMMVQDSVLADQRAADAETMKGILNQNKYVPPAGSQIVERRNDSPHHNDAQWQEIRADLDAAQAKLGQIDERHPEYNETSVLIANLTTSLSERETEATQAALDAGTLTHAELGTQAAHQSLAEKATAVANMFKGGATE